MLRQFIFKQNKYQSISQSFHGLQRLLLSLGKPLRSKKNFIQFLMRYLFLALCLNLIPGYTLALGLGQMEVQSFLHQPLQARIPLVLSQNEHVTDISVSLASMADFANYHIPRPAYLDNLQFKVVETRQQPYIQVTTQQAVTEPAIRFLLQINSPAGRVVHAYTALLDIGRQVEQNSTEAIQDEKAQATIQQKTDKPIETGAGSQLQQQLAETQSNLTKSQQAYDELKQAHSQLLAETQNLKNMQTNLAEELQTKTTELAQVKAKLEALNQRILVDNNNPKGWLGKLLIGLVIILVGAFAIYRIQRDKPAVSSRVDLSELLNLKESIMVWIDKIKHMSKADAKTSTEKAVEVNSNTAQVSEPIFNYIEQPITPTSPAEAVAEIEPLEEAGVYFVYGRYDQALKVLFAAIEKNPERVDLKRKLFEVYAAKGDKAAFEDLITQIGISIPEENSEFWQSVQELYRSTWLKQEAEQTVNTIEIREDVARQQVEMEICDVSPYESKAVPEVNFENGNEAVEQVTVGSGLADEIKAAPEIALADEDVIATKLDMARSCVEIGAVEDAKKLLLEIQKLGDAAQREEAERLLQRLQ